jgi:hypothetical protein
MCPDYLCYQVLANTGNTVSGNTADVIDIGNAV